MCRLIPSSMSVCPACQSQEIKEDFPVSSWLEINSAESSPVHKFFGAMKKNECYGIESISRCQSCGMRFASPYPADRALSDFYQEYYANRNYKAKTEKKVKRALRRLRRLNRAGKYQSFLDVGCNIGTAVEAARLSGLQATGIEIDSDSVAMARELYPDNEFEIVSVQGFAKSGRKFDIIYTTEVIEHLKDVDGFIDAIYQLLTPEGVLYLTTPDGGHFRTPRDIRNWHEMKLPEHISLFTRPALKNLLTRHKFKAPKFQFNWKPGIRMTARKAA